MGTPYGVSNAGVCRTEHHCVCQPSEICDNTLVLHFRDCSFATIKQERLYSVRGETYRQNHRRAKPQRDALQKSIYPMVVTGGGEEGVIKLDTTTVTLRKMRMHLYEVFLSENRIHMKTGYTRNYAFSKQVFL